MKFGSPSQTMKLKALAASVLGLAMAGSSVDAALIVQDSLSAFTANTTFDITARGGVDWAYWNTAGSATGVADNSKAGASLISGVSPQGGGALQGSAFTRTPVGFSFTDGTTPVSGSADRVYGIFNTLTQTVGAGVSMTIDLPMTSAYSISLWTTATNTPASTLSLSLAGATTYLTSTTVASNATNSFLYVFTVQADTAGDDLTISLINNSNAQSGGRVLFDGVAVVAAVPEPSVTGLVIGAGFVGLIFLRRRKMICS